MEQRINCVCGKLVLIIQNTEITNINKFKVDLSGVTGTVGVTCKCGKKVTFPLTFFSESSILQLI